MDRHHYRAAMQRDLRIAQARTREEDPSRLLRDGKQLADWLRPAGTAVADFVYGKTKEEQGKLVDLGYDPWQEAKDWAESAKAKRKASETLAGWLAQIQAKCGKCKAVFEPDPPKISTDPKVVADFGNKRVYALVLAEDLHGRCVPR